MCELCESLSLAHGYGGLRTLPGAKQTQPTGTPTSLVCFCLVYDGGEFVIGMDGYDLF